MRVLEQQSLAISRTQTVNNRARLSGVEQRFGREGRVLAMDVTAAESAAGVEGQKAQMRAAAKPVNRAASASRWRGQIGLPGEEREIEGDD